MNISEQVKELKEMADNTKWASFGECTRKIYESALRQAADTIEALSAKMAAENMERLDSSGWIPCEDRLPNYGGQYYLITAKESDRYHVTFAKWKPRYKQWDMSGARSFWKVIAWMPMPEVYRNNPDGGAAYE